jgi:hypothetical protein
MAKLESTNAWPSGINLLIGIWVFISAFVWPHAMAQQTNAWILGVLIALASAWAMYTPTARYLNTIFAIWLFVSTLVIVHQSAATLWSNLLSAIVVFVLSLVPGGAPVTTSQRPIHA